ncbi:3D domain-containing protein [Enterococcus massiliensis]|uniref:3D domain-containing protein n=1 Tax=Enterococcus massiliensis TaxID=1640685 RepID=UPI00065E1F5F|nr:3D domain-containing protein [Enterococcus massiliensis]
MKTRLIPVMMTAAVLAIGNILPVYAAETQDEKTTIDTEIVSNDSAKELSSSLLALTANGEAVAAVKADIAAKEKAAAEKAAKEKAAKEKAAKEKAAAEKAAKEKAEQAAKEQAAEEAKAAEEAAAEESQPSGQTMVMESTAYSSDPADALGGGTVTATGQNLLENPMAVAVDPSVIPLGTRLYVEGYGEAYAVDTGSAIQGNIIDVHFPTAAECNSWGRRQVTVTILS